MMFWVRTFRQIESMGLGWGAGGEVLEVLNQSFNQFPSSPHHTLRVHFTNNEHHLDTFLPEVICGWP